jgi:hypothetical protein
MIQAGRKIKRSGIWLLPLPFHKVLVEKLGGDYNKSPLKTFRDYTLNSEVDHSRKIEECLRAIW